MENKKVTVFFHQQAKNSIGKIAACIEKAGYPKTAETFSNELYDFGDSMDIFPNRYPLCRHTAFAKRKLRCAVFLKNYIFVYKTVHNRLIIYNVIHAKTLK